MIDTIQHSICESIADKDDICPIMQHVGYAQVKKRMCSYPKLKKMIPAGVLCCNTESSECLVAKIPSINQKYRNLVEEMLFDEYYGNSIDEKKIRKHVISFFT